MKYMRLTPYAGIAGVIFSAISLYLWSSNMDLHAMFPVLSNAGALLYGVAYIAYWYGMAMIGKRYADKLLIGTAVFFCLSAILPNLMLVLYYALPSFPSWLWSTWDALGYFLELGTGIALILAGIALMRLKKQFGDIAFWYGTCSMLTGALLLAGNFGFSYITMFSMTLDVILYVLGSMILFRETRRR